MFGIAFAVATVCAVMDFAIRRVPLYALLATSLLLILYTPHSPMLLLACAGGLLALTLAALSIGAPAGDIAACALALLTCSTGYVNGILLVILALAGILLLRRRWPVVPIAGTCCASLAVLILGHLLLPTLV
jgi:hypothetical protein